MQVVTIIFNWSRIILKRILQIAIITTSLSVFADDSTVLLMHFDGNDRPAYSIGKNKQPIIPRDIKDGDITYVPGRFKQAMRLERLSNANVGYDVKKELNGSGGTIEFWYKPEWDITDKLGNNEGQKWLRGMPIRIFFINNMQAGSGVKMFKSQYNVLTFQLSRRYKIICVVSCFAKHIFKKADDWVHLAVSWDREEARLFGNGRLMAVSNFWDMNYFQSPLRIGGHSGGSGAYDEFRVSDKKIYISSFPVPDHPFAIPERKKKKVDIVPKVANDVKEKFISQKITFYTNFVNGKNANFACGDPLGKSNRQLDFQNREGRHVLKLKRYKDGIGDTLGYEVRGNMNPFMGTLQMCLNIPENCVLPFILFDSTHISSLRSKNVGMRLLVNENKQLEWQSIHGKVLSSVVSPPMELTPGKTVKVGFSWKNSEIVLYRDGLKIAEKGENIIPPRLGRYFFIGSNCLAENTFPGEIFDVAISTTDKSIDCSKLEMERH